MFDPVRLTQADNAIAAYGRYVQSADVLLKDDVDPDKLYADHPRAYEAVRYALAIAHGDIEHLNVPGLQAWDLVARQVGSYVLAARRLARSRYAFADPAGSDAWLLIRHSTPHILNEEQMGAS